ncbi:M56 family metallopeptidase [Hyphococcus sp.]|uniref:M56 family metallopeptidase n=1 Tax=Hyphococcus sp. TaxID=2038636 RepID=UPI003CCB79E0
MTAIDILRWLGETSLAVSLLTLLVLVIRKPFAKTFGARAAYALWLAPAARLFMPELKLLPAPAQGAFEWAVAPLTAEPFASSGAVAASPAGYDIVSIAAATALVIWALVAFAWFNIKLETQAKFVDAMKAKSTPAANTLAATGDHIASTFGLKQAPKIRIADDETGPCVAGLLRPVIFLPAAFETGFTERERHLALAHEIAHVARRDMLAMIAALAVQSLQWPNPLAHYAFRKFRVDQEAACDAYVLARFRQNKTAAIDYAAAIMKSVRPGHMSSPAYGLSLAHPVKERLMLLKNQNNSALRKITGAVCAAAFIAASLAATASYGYQDEDTDMTIIDAEQSSKMTITVNDEETMEIEGLRNPAKVEYDNQNGARTVRVYNKRGKLISEDIYEPGETMAFDEVVVKNNDGETTHRINLSKPPAPPAPPQFSLMKSDGLDGDGMVWSYESDTGGEHRQVIIRKGANGAAEPFAFSSGGEPFAMAFGDMDAECIDMGDDGPVIMQWRSENGSDDNDIKVHKRSHEIVCLDRENAAPAERAEALRKAIAHMEENAKREAKRREEMIAKMRAQLQEAEEDARDD